MKPSLKNAFVEHKTTDDAKELNLFLGFDDQRIGSRIIEIPLEVGMSPEELIVEICKKLKTIADDFGLE